MARPRVTPRDIARAAKDRWHSRSSSYLRRAFHGDRIYQRMILELIKGVGASVIVETGTYLGDSTRFLAGSFPRLPVHTSEIDPDLALRARRRLRRCTNVRVYRGSSEAFVAAVLKDVSASQKLFLFLDAHWHDYWPLEDEIGHIARRGTPCVFVIDDFQVPGRPEFGFDVEGLDSTATIADGGRVCGIDLLVPCLTGENDYRALLPTYSYDDAFTSPEGVLRGHIVVFQNLEDAFARFTTGDRFFASYYEPVDLMSPTSASEGAIPSR